jgi:hypothetical protein
LESGVAKQDLQIFAGNVSRVFLNKMLRMARSKRAPPIEAWLQDDAPLREFARRINAQMRRDARSARDR